jgi:hypothetical protein
VENLGCPNLRIIGAEVKPLDDTTAVSDDVAFYLDSPAVPPTLEQPLVVSSNGGGFTMDVRFAPELDSLGKANTFRAAILELRTNDPVSSTLEVSLFGEAGASDFSVTPTFCDLSAQGNICGAVLAGGHSEGTFTVHNEGTTALTLNGAFAKGGQAGRFESVDLNGASVPVGGSTTFRVRYQDQALYVRDTLMLTATAAGQEAGMQSVGLAGGIPPCLTTTPATQVDFGAPLERATTRTVALSNGPGCGRLVVSDIHLTQPAQHFELLQEDVDAILQGGPIDAGQSRTFRVRYTRPVIGGNQTAQLRITSNAPNASDTQPLLLLLSANSP